MKELLTSWNIPFIKVDSLRRDFSYYVDELVRKEFISDEICPKVAEIKIYVIKSNVITGRPPKEIDIQEVIKQRVEQKKSYQQIADNLKCSISLIYSKIPKEIIKKTGDIEKVRKWRKKREERFGAE